MTSARDLVEDRSRFAILYEVNYPGIVRYIFRRLPEGSIPEDAADIAAEVFATAWREFPRLPSPPQDRLWLYGVARKRLDRHRRSIWRRARLSSRLAREAINSSDLGDGRLGAGSNGEQIRAALARLDAPEREVILLTTWDGLSHAEAALILGCTANAVGVRLHRARARLREQMTDESGRASFSPHDGAAGKTRET
jgi:RNA polymerase sigma-70 factor (ECF subfamily)